MGSFVLGYELTSYGHLFQLLTEANQFEDQEQYVNLTTLLNSLLALTAIFGTGCSSKVCRSIDVRSAPLDT